MKAKDKIKLQSEAATLFMKLTGLTTLKKIPVLVRLGDIVTLLTATVIAYVAPIFKRAKSVVEFHKNSAAFAHKSNSSYQVGIDVLNDCGEALLEATDRFNLPKMLYFGSGQLAPHRVNLPSHVNACYASIKKRWGIVDQILLNDSLENEPKKTPEETKRHWDLRYPLDEHIAFATRKIKDPRALEVVHQLEYWVWSQSGHNVKYVMYHEVGHRWDKYMRMHVPGFESVGRKAFRAGWACCISKYGMTNQREFLAESFSCYLQNKHHLICPELLELMKKHDKAVLS